MNSNPDKRLQALREKAELGDAQAQYDLGLKYYRGEDVPQDMTQARMWLSKAAQQGQRDAQVLLNLRGMRLNQGVEFKLSEMPPKAPPPRVKDPKEFVLLTGTPQEQMVLLASQVRDALSEAGDLLPDEEPLKERIVEGLGAMLKCLDSGELPSVRERGMMTLGSTVYRGLEGYDGELYERWKAKVYRIGRAFEDLKTGDVEEGGRAEGEAASGLGPPKDKYEKVGRIADAIESELRAIRFWSDEPPTPEMMEFRQAFAMDTMPFAMWVQFVLLPRIRSIIAERGQFPHSSSVGAHAVREFDGQHEASNLVSLLSELDEAVTRG